MCPEGLTPGANFEVANGCNQSLCSALARKLMRGRRGSLWDMRCAPSIRGGHEDSMGHEPATPCVSQMR